MKTRPTGKILTVLSRLFSPRVAMPGDCSGKGSGKPFGSLAAAGLALLAGVLASNAANLTWDANTALTGAQDGSGTWDTAANNWWTGSANTTWNSATPDWAFFGAANGVAGTVTLGAPIVCSNITFNAASVGNYTIAGGGYTLGLTNRTIAANANATISADIVGAANLTLANSGANAPSAVLTLSGNNTFSGTMNIGVNAANTTAALRAASSTALGTVNNISFGGGQGNLTSHRLELMGGITLTNPCGLSGRNTPGAAFVSISGANTLSGPITFGSGGITYTFQVDGASALALAGTTTVQAAGGRVMWLRGTGSGNVSGAITGGAVNSPTNFICKSGSGTWTLSGANTFIGATDVAGGTLTLDYSAQDNSKLADGMPLYLAGGTLNLNGGSHVEVVSSNMLVAGASSVTRASGTSTLRLNAINRLRGGVVNFGAASIADTDTLNVNGILGSYATVAGADWAINSTGAGDGPITAYTGYTDIAATGSTIADGATSNVRLNSDGSGGNIALGATTTTINTLLQNHPSFTSTIDTASKTLRLGATGGVLVPSGKGSLIIGTAANSGTLTAGGADNTAGEIIVNNVPGVEIRAVIADNGTGPVSLTKAGSGTLSLSGSNTHTGTNYIVGGTLNITAANNLGSGLVVLNGGTLNVTATTDLTSRPIVLGPQVGFGNGTISVAAGQTATYNGNISNNVSGLVNPNGGIGAANSGILGMYTASTLTKTGDGTLVLGGANAYALGTIILGGTVSVSSSGNLGLLPGCYIPDHLVINGGTLQAAATFALGGPRGIMLGPIGGSGGGTVLVDDGQTLTLESRIADNWNGTGSLTKTGTGTLIVTSVFNDYSGNTTVSAGTLQVNNSRAIPNGAGKGNVALSSILNLNGVNVALNGLSGSGTVDNNSGTAATLAVGNNDQTSTFGGVIQGALALAKAGSGTLTLSGASTYSGSTLINGGTLALSGSGSTASTTNIVVGPGAIFNVTGLSGGTMTLNSGQTLSGAGTVQGTIADSSGAAIAPGLSAGTLTVSGGLTLNGGGNLNYELANVTTIGGGVNDLLVVNGTLNIAGSTTLNLSYLNGVPAPIGKYTLIQYGSFSGDVNNISVPTGFTITNNTAAKAIELLIEHIPVNLIWRGDGSGNAWDIGSTANWIQAGTNQVFYAGDTVTFDNTGSNTPFISISGPVYPLATIVSASQDYTFSSGAIVSGGGLTKSGSGTLTLENDNVFNGGATISGGTLQIGNAGSTGTLAGGNVTNNSALVFNRADTLTITNQISGSGPVTQLGAGTTLLTASNSYAGTTLVSAGILTASNGAALGTDAAGTLVQSGAQLFIDQNYNFTNNESLNLSGTGPGDGAWRKGGGGTTTWAGPVSLGADTLIQVDGGATLSLTNAAGISGSGFNLTLYADTGGQGNVSGPVTLGGYTITKTGAGSWTLGAANSYTGKTFINAGTLFGGADGSFGPAPGAWTQDFITLTGSGLVGVTTNYGVVNFAFADGKRGITFNGDGGFNVGQGATLTITNELAGTGNLTKWGAGTLVLAGSNSLAGILYLDRWADGNINDGITRITRPDAVQNISEIRMRNTSVNTAQAATLQLDGSAGNLTLSQPIWFSCRQDAATNPTLQSLIGSNTLTGAISLMAGGNHVNIQADAGAKLAIAGNIRYEDTLTALRNIKFMGDGDTLVAGEIQASANGITPVALIKTGNGTLTLAGANTYSDITTVSNGVLLLTGSISSTGTVTVAGGTLSGPGTINTAVNVLAGGTLSPGASLGTLTVNGNLTLGGTTYVELDKNAGTNDVITVANVASYGGTLVVTNLAGTLSIGNTFQLFSASFIGGNFASIVNQTGQGGIGFTFNPVNGVLSVVQGTASYPTNVSYSRSGSTLSLSWPSTHLGWILQSQTNALNVGIRTNASAWFDWPGTASVTATNLTLNPANPTVFFRLRRP